MAGKRLAQHLVAGAVSVSMCPLSSAAFELEAQLDGVSEEVDIETRPVEGGNGNYTWHTDVRRAHAEYLRLHVKSVELPEGARITLSLRDQTGAVVRAYDAGELERRTPFWTAAVTGDHAQVLVSGASVPEGFRIEFDRIAYQSEAGAPLSTYGEDRKEPIRAHLDDPVIAAAQGPVAKLLFMRDGMPRVCSGFLISNDQLMTNHHCVSDQSTCDTTIALFGYQVTADGRLAAGKQYECLDVPADKRNHDLDFAVLTLAGSPGVEWGRLNLAAEDPATVDPEAKDTDALGLAIIQHPSGYPKMISVRGCGATQVPVDGRAPGSDFAHRCDTLGGSSGSPVLDLEGRVVGLHHYGFGDGEGQAGAWAENRAVRMALIRKHVETPHTDCP